MHSMLIANAALFGFLGCIWNRSNFLNVAIKLFFFGMCAADVIVMTWGMKP